MEHPFEIIRLVDHPNRGQFIFARQLDFEQLLEVPDGALLHGIPVYHYEKMYPLRDANEQPRWDVYVFRSDPVRYPEGHFWVGQQIVLVLPMPIFRTAAT